MKKISIVLAGLLGNMASLVAKRIVNHERYKLMPFAFTGDGLGGSFNIPSKEGNFSIKLLEPKDMYTYLTLYKKAKEHHGKNSDFIVIDFTQPDAANDNCKFYCDNKIPFVMGTTGGNRELLMETVENSDTVAVIAPNMSVPIVMLMSMIEFAAKAYSGVLADWEIRIVESHQSAKRDISGTAIAIGKQLKNLGVNYEGEENIRIIRDEIEQIFHGIPRDALGGHGWHQYSLVSPDGNVRLGFEHNINGRDTYVDGTLMAVDFLAKKISEGYEGSCFSMIDVMRG